MKIKTRLILWYTLLAAALLAAVLIFLLTAGGKILFTGAQDVLRTQTQEMAGEIDFEDGRLELDDDFRLSSKGVQLTVYQGGTPAAGQLPADFPADEPLQAGALRRVGAYLVYDLPVTGDVMLRGCYSTETLTDSSRGVLTTALIAVPLLLLAAALGGRWIITRSFRPLDQISRTAAGIQNGGDLTARIALPDTNDEVAALAAAFDGMLDRLEESFQAEKQFSSDVSHELRTPIAVIQSQCEYALSGVDGAAARGALEEIQSTARDMSTLVARLLELSRAEHGAASIRLQAVNLSELMEIVSEELADAAMKERIALTVDAPEGLTVNGEQTLLVRLLLNLTGNALKYTPEGGHIRLSAEQTPDRVLLRVADDGIGMAPQHLDKIFRRFYRVDSSRSREESDSGGYGLGLAFCRWIAEVHHAVITVQSTPGQGSVFTVAFPLVSPPAGR